MKIKFGTKALKFLSKLDRDGKERVFKKIKELGNDPFPSDVKKIKGERDVYRIRIGAFRVLYKTISKDDTILIFRVDKRSRVYKR
ncbi:MAG: type II toxin-antitoxin system RelE/ParE family toxin [Methanosarcinales archaeon]|nr:type II toxin-antitoxin system RelE/ParE family toxin [Methanosarcinales archaeon]